MDNALLKSLRTKGYESVNSWSWSKKVGLATVTVQQSNADYYITATTPTKLVVQVWPVSHNHLIAFLTLVEKECATDTV